MLTSVTISELAILSAIYLHEKNYTFIGVVEADKTLRDKIRDEILDRYDSIPKWLAPNLKVRNKGEITSQYGSSIIIVRDPNYLKGRTLDAVFCRHDIYEEVAMQYIPCGAQIIEYTT